MPMVGVSIVYRATLHAIFEIDFTRKQYIIWKPAKHIFLSMKFLIVWSKFKQTHSKKVILFHYLNFSLFINKILK